MKKLIVILGLIALISCEKAEPIVSKVSGCGIIEDKRINPESLHTEWYVNFNTHSQWVHVSTYVYVDYNLGDEVCWD